MYSIHSISNKKIVTSTIYDKLVQLNHDNPTTMLSYSLPEFISSSMPRRYHYIQSLGSLRAIIIVNEEKRVVDAFWYESDEWKDPALELFKHLDEEYSFTTIVVRDNDLIPFNVEEFEKTGYRFKLVHHLKDLPPISVNGVYFNRYDESEEMDSAIVNILNQSYTDAKEIPDSIEQVPVTVNDIKNIRNKENYFQDGVYFVKQIKDELLLGASICFYDSNTKEGFFSSLQILPEHRRKGLGTAVTVETLDILKTQGAKFVTVAGRLENPHCIDQLYIKSGFEQEQLFNVWKRRQK